MVTVGFTRIFLSFNGEQVKHLCREMATPKTHINEEKNSIQYGIQLHKILNLKFQPLNAIKLCI